MGGAVYDFEAKSLAGKHTSLREYSGKVMLIVNTASKCGFTPQYEALEVLYEKHRDQGFVVLGFPCNQFGAQEPGSEQEIAAFCEKNFGVSFPMFEKIEVNGANAHPLYQWLKKSAPGLLGSERIKWNFTKFLIDRAGAVVERYAPMTKPEDLERDVEKLL
ncbi:MAG TPA: glutathione peroxidase [Steroidobacter sp.]|jgi:glutathione peroxidase|nr:glutathione peroxidase [Steroidobacter sp.]